jgi:hypothetical protein
LRVCFADAAGRAEPHLRERAGQSRERRDPSGRNRGEELHDVKSMRQSGHQLGACGDTRYEGQVLRRRGFEQVLSRSRAQCELGADFGGKLQVPLRKYGAYADNRLRHIGDDGFGGRSRHRRSQCDLQEPQTARDQRPRKRDGIFGPFDRDDRDDSGKPEKLGQAVSTPRGLRSGAHNKVSFPSRVCGLMRSAIACRGMMAPG